MKVMGIKWNSPLDTMAYQKTGGDKSRLFMANEAKRLMSPYVPFASGGGGLDTNVKAYVEKHCGIVHYQSVYARFQFEGFVMVGMQSGSPFANYGEKKVVTDRELVHSDFRHPLATSHWDQAMLTARGEDLISAVQNYLKKGG